jgi:hypothetical protein
VSQEIAVRAPQRLDAEQVKYIAATEFVPKAYRGNLPAIMAALAYGRELGLGDMESLRSIHMIDGKPAMPAELMVRLVRKRGHSITGSFGPEEATAHGKRKDNDDEMTVTWTLEMAKRAGLHPNPKKENWMKYPEAMLWARAASQLCRMLFPDCLSGLVYTPDEAEMSEEERIAEALAVRVPDTGVPDDTPKQIGDGERVADEREIRRRDDG